MQESDLLGDVQNFKMSILKSETQILSGDQTLCSLRVTFILKTLKNPDICPVLLDPPFANPLFMKNLTAIPFFDTLEIALPL